MPIDPQSGAHEYHEISDEEVGESPAFDLGPSLMDEVLKALGGGGSSHTSTAAGTTGKVMIEWIYLYMCIVAIEIHNSILIKGLDCSNQLTDFN